MALRRSLFTLGSRWTLSRGLYRSALQRYVHTNKPLVTPSNVDSKSGFPRLALQRYVHTERSLKIPATFDETCDYIGAWEDAHLCIVNPNLSQIMICMVQNIIFLEENSDWTDCMRSNLLFTDFTEIVQDAAVASAGDAEDVRKKNLREALRKILMKVIDRLRLDGRPGKMYVLDQFIRAVDNIQDPDSLPKLVEILRRLPFLTKENVLYWGS